MRLFLVQFGSLFAEHIRVAEELRKRHEILYWTRQEVIPLDKGAFPGTIFHEYRDALKGIAPPAVDTSTFEPWSAEAISAFAGTESELMTMMDKWYPAWPSLKRKDFYYEQLRYWGGVLEQFAPDCIVFLEVPHDMYGFVLYRVARSRGIRTLMFENVLRYDRLLMYREYEKGNETLAEASARGFRDKAVTPDDLSPEVRDHYLELSGKKDPEAPGYMKAFKSEHTGWNKLRRRTKALIPFVKDGSIFERAVLRLFKTFKRGVQDEYRSVLKDADFTRPFVYVPLSYQPERTTSPQGGIFVNQLAMVRMLSAALPKSWELYIKEHPAQHVAHGRDYNAYRWRGVYEDIARIPNVRLVPTTTNTFELAQHAKAVATVTGTAAWEAILRGTPALVFGYTWFMHAPGIFRVSGTGACRSAFKEIERGFCPDAQHVLNYLKVLNDVSVPGFIDGHGYRIASDETRANWRALYDAIERALGKE